MLKKGNKVKIKKLEPSKEYGDVWYGEEMRTIADKEETYTIEIVKENMKPYPIYFLKNVPLFFFNDEMLEKIS